MPKNRLIILYIAASAVLAWLVTAWAADAGDIKPSARRTLRYRTVEGKKWAYAVKTTRKVRLKLPKIGMDLGRTSHLTMDYTLGCLPVQEKGAIFLGIRINRIHMVTQTGAGTFKTDFSNVIGQSFHMVATELGKFIKFAGVEKLKATARIPNGTTTTIGIEHFFNPLLLEFPKESVDIGDSWYRDINETVINTDGLEQMMAVRCVYTYEGLREIQGRNCMRISMTIEGAVTWAGNENTGLLDNYSEFSGVAKSRGTIFLDPEMVMVVRSEIEHIISGKLHIKSYLGQFFEPYQRVTTIQTTLMP